jgi:membrane protein
VNVTDNIARRIRKVPIGDRGHRVLLAFYALYQDMNRKDLLKHASAMAYVTLLSLIPSLVAIFAVLSLFSPLLGKEGDIVESLRDLVLNNLTPDSGDAVVTYLDEMLANLNLKTIGITSFGSVLVTLVLLLRQIEEALNRIWLVHKGRNPITRFMYFWTFLTFGAVVVGVAIGFSSGFDLKHLLGLDGQGTAAVPEHGIVGSLIGWAGGFLFFFFLYKVVPNCRVMWKNAAIGAVIASFCLNQASRVYGFVVVGSKSYKTLYGALAQLPIFLTWLYICWIIILVGALLSWRLQEGFPQTKEEDTLEGGKTPLELMRNMQLRANLPLVVLIAIHRRFNEGSGERYSAQSLAHLLHLPLSWVAEALAGLESLGYLVAGSGSPDEVFYPTSPAHALSLGRVLSELGKPMDDWMTHWRPELGIDVPRALFRIRTVELHALAKTTLAQALELQ